MRVTIVIPNYNGKHFMKPCLESLDRQTCKDFEIIVVDNASSDGSIEYMKETYPDIHCIGLDKNYGFSRAVNEGIRASRTPYVILLNNDTTVDPRYVEEMLKAIRKSKRIFSVSSKMIQMYHPELIDSAGDLYTLMGWGVCRGTGRPVSNYTQPDEIFTACAGAACALKDRMEEEGLAGTIRVYGCPAEEIVIGKIRMNQEGIFDDLSAAVTWHPFDRNRVSYDIWQAQDIKNYKFYGTAAHASKHPEAGRSALDAAELMNVGVPTLPPIILSVQINGSGQRTLLRGWITAPGERRL